MTLADSPTILSSIRLPSWAGDTARANGNDRGASVIVLDTDVLTLANSAILISRNLTDFRKVPELIVEDWCR
jgi:hypothetical protein